MGSKRLLLIVAYTLVIVPLAGCASSEASIDKSINDYYFPDKAAKDSQPSSSQSTEVLDTIPDASEVKELNE